MNKLAIDDFQRMLAQFYLDYGRHDMLWRQPEPDGSFDAYKILVSELMLQQTQVSRVTPKYIDFLGRFPNIQSLAAASLGKVLQLWSGLGYNRRAKFLWQAAQTIGSEFSGVFPQDYTELTKLPGVGPNTAGAILAYAYNQPVVYVETNIRTVIIHHFFQDETAVSDNAIREIIQQMLEPLGVMSPREFYWALMDYGAHLKATVGNLNHASTSYSRQSAFAGSKRQLRGQAIRLLAESPLAESELVELLADDRAAAVLADLLKEGMMRRDGKNLSLH